MSLQTRQAPLGHQAIVPCRVAKMVKYQVVAAIRQVL